MGNQVTGRVCEVQPHKEEVVGMTGKNLEIIPIGVQTHPSVLTVIFSNILYLIQDLPEQFLPGGVL